MARSAVARLAALILGGAALAGCVASPPTPEPGASPATATASRDGLQVTVTLLGPPRTADVSWADLTVENIGDRAVRWAGGGCGDPGGIFIDLDAGMPTGREWPGRLGVFKQQALGMDGEAGLAVNNVGYEAAARWGRNIACPASLSFEELRPGGRLAFRGVWNGMLNGGPAPAGPASVVGLFPVIGFVGEVPDDRIETDPVIVRLDTTIVGVPGQPAMPPALAIDAALADPEFAAWVQAADPATWINPSVGVLDGQWRVGLFRNGIPVDRTLFGEVTVDANGAIVARRFEP